MRNLAENRKGIAEEDFETLVKKIRVSTNSLSELTALLKDSNSVYDGKSTAAVNRMRGFLYYSFSYSYTPEEAFIYLFEEMESGDNAYAIASAAIAIRHSKVKSQEMPELLIKGLTRAIQHNDYISYDHYFQNSPLQNRTSALEEVLSTISWLGPLAIRCLGQLKFYAQNRFQKLTTAHVILVEEAIKKIEESVDMDVDCCTMNLNTSSSTTKSFFPRLHNKQLLKHITLEDQDAEITSMANLFTGKFSVLAFFYTRCENPSKCSLTVTNLAHIQNLLEETGFSNHINIMGISYDSFYDKPNLLKNYGNARGLKCNKNARILRVTSSFHQVSEYFDLGVNFAGPIVNRHAIDLFIVDPNGKIVDRFERRQINNVQIAKQIIQRIEQHNLKEQLLLTRVSKGLKATGSFLSPILFALLPKCPFCLGAYLSVIGITGLQLSPYFKYIVLATFLLMIINLFALYKMGKSKGGYASFFFSLAGSLCVLISRYWLTNNVILAFGFILLFIGMVLNALPARRHFWRKKTTTTAIPHTA